MHVNKTQKFNFSKHRFLRNLGTKQKVETWKHRALARFFDTRFPKLQCRITACSQVDVNLYSFSVFK